MRRSGNNQGGSVFARRMAKMANLVCPTCLQTPGPDENSREFCEPWGHRWHGEPCQGFVKAKRVDA